MCFHFSVILLFWNCAILIMRMNSLPVLHKGKERCYFAFRCKEDFSDVLQTLNKEDGMSVVWNVVDPDFAVQK